MTNKNSQFIIIIVLLLAAFFRFYQLPALPPGLNFDEAGNGVAAQQLLSGDLHLWWRIGGGKEPLWPYLIALSTALLGNVPLALRLPAAFAGVLTVAAVVPLARALFHRRPGSEMVALLAALALAVSEWHLHFSRLGFRAVLLPLLSALAFTFFWRGYSGRPRLRITGNLRVANSLAAAFLLALGVYAYLAGRMLPAVLLLFVLLDVARRGLARRRPLLGRGQLNFLAQLAAFLLLLLLPLVIYFAVYPADFLARAGTVSIFNPQWNHGDLPGTALRTLALDAGTFLAQSGDANPLVNLPGQPALPLLAALFFALGLLVALFRAARPPHLFLPVWWAVMLLPAVLAPEGAPHHLRLIGALVPAIILLALGLTAATRALARVLRRPALAALLPAAVFLWLAGQTYANYFVRWPAAADFTLPFDLYAVQLAGQIAQTPATARVILPMDNRAAAEARHYTVDYLLGGPNAANYATLPVDERTLAPALTQAAAGKTELRVVRWTADKHLEADARELLTFLLATSGAVLTERQTFPVFDVEMYKLQTENTHFSLPTPDQPVGTDFDHRLLLKSKSVPAVATAGESLPVVLTFAPAGPADADYKVSLRLVAPDGARVAQKDRVLLHNFHQGTSLWPPEPVNEYYLLPVPPDTPPGDYTVTLVLYHPETQAPLISAGQPEIPLGGVRVE